MNNWKKYKLDSFSFFLGYMIPGLGHLYLGRVWQGIVFMIPINTCYLLGTLLGGGLIWTETNILNLLGFIVKFFNGLPFLIALSARSGPVNASSYCEIGTAFILISGALNMLVLIHLFDVIKEKNEDKSL
jgi:TM2 domain-containing membrane protein YozV